MTTMTDRERELMAENEALRALAYQITALSTRAVAAQQDAKPKRSTLVRVWDTAMWIVALALVVVAGWGVLAVFGVVPLPPGLVAPPITVDTLPTPQAAPPVQSRPVYSAPVAAPAAPGQAEAPPAPIAPPAPAEALPAAPALPTAAIVPPAPAVRVVEAPDLSAHALPTAEPLRDYVEPTALPMPPSSEYAVETRADGTACVVAQGKAICDVAGLTPEKIAFYVDAIRTRGWGEVRP